MTMAQGLPGGYCTLPQALPGQTGSHWPRARALEKVVRVCLAADTSTADMDSSQGSSWHLLEQEGPRDSDGELQSAPSGCPPPGCCARRGAHTMFWRTQERKKLTLLTIRNKTCFEDTVKGPLGLSPGLKGSEFHRSKTRVQKLQLSWQSPSCFHQMQSFALVRSESRPPCSSNCAILNTCELVSIC